MNYIEFNKENRDIMIMFVDIFIINKFEELDVV
jgi:hypothetical protein